MPSEQRKPLWLIPNLLSLDAPLVAVAWLYIFAKTWRADYLPWTAYFSLGLVVWVIYVTDRLLDSSIRNGMSEKLEARHDFHRKHQVMFRILAVLAGIGAMVMVIGGMPVRIYENSLMGGILVVGFFALSIFSTNGPNEIPYAKNILAGLSFGFGTALIAFVYTGFDWWEFILSRELISFSVLCFLNISAIDLWEHANRSSDPEMKATDELALTLPLTLLGGASLVFASQDHELTTRPFFYAVLTGAALLHILNRTRSRFSMDALRVLADVALLIPFIVFLAASRS
ncbi:MAG: hypothetical protein V4584_10235 [Verrucomicrobiota bacterium]